MQDMRVKVNQVELQIREYGQDGEAIIFLHFSSANLMMWQRVVPMFQDHYRLILVDLRGHGKSDKPESDYHIDQMARDVVGVMQQLKLEQAHVVGSSLGAEVGLSLAANHPEKVISLVCDGALSSEYGPYGTWEGSEADFEAHAAGVVEKLRATPDTIYPTLDALVAKVRQGLEEIGWWNESVEAMERYGACPAGEGKYTRGLPKKAMADYMQHYFHCRFEEYYRKVKCPVLMVTGAVESERERVVMEGLRALAARAQIVEVSGWEHPYGWMLDPEAMCQVILKFLGEVA